MYCLTLYRSDSLMSADLAGEFTTDEMQALSRDLDRRLLDPGLPIRRLLIDARQLESTDDFVLGLLQVMEERIVEAGARVAKVVESELIAHQLDQVLEGSGFESGIKHFWDRDAALSWLRGAPG